MNTSFEDFWNLFDNKKSRDKCERKWNLMSAKDQQACMDSLPVYIKATPDRQYRKHPATYLNNKCWNDKIYGKDSEAQILHKDTPNQVVSTYKPKEYDRSEAIAHMRNKLKANFENGSFIQDWGGVYTKLLRTKFPLTIPKDILEGIKSEVNEIANTPRKNRFEPVVTINVESEVRDRCLNWWLSQQRENGVKVYEKI